ncbi:hypothetical protein Q3G72_006826 [Acer saccharum]|nr:hypothetical protein Q3G72_006826 [Acer saccharum]
MDTTKLLSLLRTCSGSGSKSLIRAKLIHQKIVIQGLQNNIVLCKSLINLYFSCQNYDSAKLVFRTIENPLDLSLWNGLMVAYTKNYMFFEALDLFDRLLQNPFLKPDSFAYPSVLKACGGLGRVGYGKMIHTHLIKTGFGLDVVVSSSLVGMYAKCHKFEYAIKVFDEMPDRDVASWNTVISCYYQDGQAEKALELFKKMRDSGFEPNSVTLTIVISSCSRLLDLERGKEIHKEYVKDGFVFDSYVSSALVDMYGKCGCLEMAREVFEQTPVKSVVAWNSMIGAYSSKGDSKSCIELFRSMHLEGIKPTVTTLSSIIMSSSRSAQLEHGKFIHGYIIRNRIQTDIFIDSSLIDLYFKCGCVSSAENVFDKTVKTNVVSWNVMVSGYVTVGNYFKALSIHEDMKETSVKPDAVTFTSILSACSQLAALEKGKEIHKYIVESELESNEIAMGALLDMYAKCGAVDQAFNVFQKLPEKDLVSWTSMITAYGLHEAYGILLNTPDIKDDVGLLSTLFSACRLHGNTELGERVARLLVEKDPDDPSTYIVLSNMYASVNKWDKVRQVRLKMKALRLKKNPGCSWIEIEKKIHSFFAEDMKHPQADKVHECLKMLTGHMEKDELPAS